MRRHTLILTAVVATITTGSTWAASKSDKADRVVDAVLQLEARGMVERREDDLSGAVDESERARWAAGYIRSTDGWQKYDANVRMDDRLREYQDRRGTETLTPEQHRELADWCRDQKLTAQERTHLWSAVLMNHHPAMALRRLGYESRDGEWLTDVDQKWRIQFDQHRMQQYLRWGAKAKSICTQLSSPNDTVREIGRRRLFEIDDDDAIPVFEKELGISSAAVANEFIQFLGKRKNLGSTRALMRLAVLSQWEPIRASASDLLRSRRADHYVPTLLSTISTPIELRIRPIKETTQGVGVAGIARVVGVSNEEVVFQREGWHQQQQLAVRQVKLVLEYGRRGILRIIPDFYAGNGLRKLELLNASIRSPRSTGLENSSQAVLEMNTNITAWNQRVAETLARSAGFSVTANPCEMWEQWASETHTELPQHKPILSTIGQEVTEDPSIRFNPMNPSCLPAGTPVMTATGLQPIESVRIGDTVLAKDIETGELSYKPVIRTTVRKPQPLMTLHTKEDSIRATLGHYFWVSGQGWRMAKEIKPGHRLHGVQGTVTVTDVTAGGNEAVYNLVVEGANSYFVGECQILSHDVTPPVPTDIVVPGLAAR